MRGAQNMGMAFKCFKRASDSDCKDAHYKVGYFLQHGIEQEKNIQLAIRKYEEATTYVRLLYLTRVQGHELAMNALGTLFYNEQKDYSQAAEWFRKAAERGCARALNNLGICCELGQGVETDFD